MSFLGWFYGADKLQKQGDELDQRLAELNQQARETGVYSETQYQQAEADRLSGLTGNADASVNEAFKEGWHQGYEDLTSGIRNTLDTTFKGVLGGVFKSVPWYFWIIGGLVLFTYFGGWRLLRRIKS